MKKVNFGNKIINLSSMLNGASIIGCNNEHFGKAENILAPGKGKNMGDGWETRRSRGKNFDWLIIKLGRTGTINKIEIDTHHFKGNYPEKCSIQAAYIKNKISENNIVKKSKIWNLLLNKVKLHAHKKHNFKNKFMKNKDSKIIFEPGRFIIGNAAILISKIIYIKKSNNINFIVLDAGMNNLMRPALYDAQHEIVPIKKANKLFRGNFEFVGPICESSDKFSNQKSFSQIKEGDYVGLTHVGAYGMSLSSNYNTRPAIAEILVTGSKHKLIKKRQSLENLVNN